MWKLLHSGQNVNSGDTIRYNDLNQEKRTFKVVKTDSHYFEIIPEYPNQTNENILHKKVIRYFDIGYYIGVEVWVA